MKRFFYIKVFLKLTVIVIFCSLSSCQQRKHSTIAFKETSYTSTDTVPNTTAIQKDTVPCKSQTALHMDSLGFINIAEADSNIQIQLVYATPKNFVGKILYKDLKEAYLHPLAMESLLKAQQLLKEQYPHYNLIIYDAARPMSIQQEMWDVVKGTPQFKYVSNPAHGGGLHNYGLAVDVSIVNEKGEALDMGCPMDFFGKEAHIDQEENLVKTQLISKDALKNRRFLRHIMRQAGFMPLRSEWWHFNRVSRKEAKAHFKVVM